MADQLQAVSITDRSNISNEGGEGAETVSAPELNETPGITSTLDRVYALETEMVSVQETLREMRTTSAASSGLS